MKNQYFGDVNDYRKYGLLRALTASGKISTAVCWMLTPDDSSSDGSLIDFLRHPLTWRHFDPELFDQLKRMVLIDGVRNVETVESSGLIPSSQFFCEVLSDDRMARRRYFESFWSLATGCELVFFDPDNGMEVKSKPCGKKDSSKYLYWHEVIRAFSDGHSVLVYQHFPRSQRDDFISRMAMNFVKRTGAGTVYSFRTAHVVFFLLLSDSQVADLERNISNVTQAWFGQIETQKHTVKQLVAHARSGHESFQKSSRLKQA